MCIWLKATEHECEFLFNSYLIILVLHFLAASLNRLRLDYVDIVYAHRPDPNVTIEEVVRAFNWVIEKGWAFYWGTSEWPASLVEEVGIYASIF